jgi:3-isopropylmalate/(R)-2-methylmalate dehydratase small subunit
MARAEELPNSQLVIDLATQTISTADGSFSRSFEIDPNVKHNLLGGFDDIALTLLDDEKISAFEAQRDNALYPSLTLAG